MLFLVSLFWNICLTRKGPEDVPTQQVLIGLLVIGKIVLVLVVTSVLQIDFSTISLITQIVTWTAIAGLLCALALQLKSKFERFVPTFSAILGTDLVVTALYGLIFMTVRLSSVEFDTDIATIFNTLVQLWTIFIVGFIMHRALDVNIDLGITASLVIKIFSEAISIQVPGLT